MKNSQTDISEARSVGQVITGDGGKKLWKRVSKMDLGNPVITAIVGLVIFYIGLKTFSGGMKSGQHRTSFMVLGQPLVYVCRWHHNDTAVAVVKLSTTAIIALVASGAFTFTRSHCRSVRRKHRHNRNNLAGRFVCVRRYA